MLTDVQQRILLQLSTRPSDLTCFDYRDAEALTGAGLAEWITDKQHYTITAAGRVALGRVQ